MTGLYGKNSNGTVHVKGFLKVPKCEIFFLFDFNDFYVIKSLQVGDLRAEIKNYFFKVWARCTILSLLGYAECTLATIFHLELAPKKRLFQIPLRSTGRCQNSFF